MVFIRMGKGGGEGKIMSLLIRSQHVLGLRPPQHLHPHVFVRDPGMWAFTRQTVQEFGEVIRSLEVETFHMHDAAVRVEQLPERSLLVFIRGLGREFGNFIDNLLFGVLLLSLDDEREVYCGLIGLVDDFERDLVVLFGYSPE